MITTADMLLVCFAFFSCTYSFYILRSVSGLIRRQKTLGNVPGFDVVVPFRHETDSLRLLETQLKAQFPGPWNRIIFVNDQSDGYLPKSEGNVRVIDNAGIGKKAALLTGVRIAESNYLLFLDADVVLPESFSREVTNNWNGSGMCVIPVMQTGNKVLQKLVSVETKMIMGITVGSVLAGDPVLANGAALLFNKTEWLKNNDTINTKYASGDDVFMLYAFKKKGLITSFLSKENLVTTDGPERLSDLFSQRLRWVGKSVAIRDFSATFFGLSTVLMYLTMIGIPFWFNTDLQVVVFLVLLLVKILSEYCLLLLIDRRMEKRTPLSIFLTLEIVYPVFVPVISLVGMFVKPRWKGRRI